MSYVETIIAQASAPGGAVRGILRLSGPQSTESVEEIFVPKFRPVPKPLVVDGSLVPWGAARPVPAKLFFWPSGRGYTGQESIEIHTIGSTPILEAVAASICQTGKVRQAHPGEFTMRAFLAGKIDLTQAEAVLGVIEAVDRNSLETALDQLAGGLARPLKELREILFETLAHLEAGFDFAEEEIEFISLDDVRQTLEKALRQTDSLRERMKGRGVSDTMLRVVLAGPPNAGKSSLFNALLGREQALVSPQRGTTRDYLEADIRLDGFPVRLVDTAGLDFFEPAEEIDRTAQRLALDKSSQADLVLFCRDDDGESPSNREGNFQLDPRRTISIRTKSDEIADEKMFENSDSIPVSSKTGFGIDRLRDHIAEKIRRSSCSGETVPGTAIRCRESLDLASLSLRNALDQWDEERKIVFDESILASEIRVALNALGLVLGEVHTDDLLDRIFSRFCIGK